MYSYQAEPNSFLSPTLKRYLLGRILKRYLGKVIEDWARKDGRREGRKVQYVPRHRDYPIHKNNTEYSYAYPLQVWYNDLPFSMRKNLKILDGFRGVE